MTQSADRMPLDAEAIRPAAWPAGQIRSFGPFGPKYQVGPLLPRVDGGDWMATITLVDSGEVTEYRCSRILDDPLAP